MRYSLECMEKRGFVIILLAVLLLAVVLGQFDRITGYASSLGLFFCNDVFGPKVSVLGGATDSTLETTVKKAVADCQKKLDKVLLYSDEECMIKCAQGDTFSGLKILCTGKSSRGVVEDPCSEEDAYCFYGLIVYTCQETGSIVPSCDCEKVKLDRLYGVSYPADK